MTPANRTFNIVVSTCALLCLAPPLLLIALVILWDDGVPVFYCQNRIGRYGIPFRLWKFRTMVAGADRSGLLTTSNDCRITRCGRFLRKYKLDELPQLWNVLRGEMQFVGPRPEVEGYVHLFADQYRILLREPPGITDPASFAYRRESELLAHASDREYVARILPRKLKLSLSYQQRRTFFSDVAILWRTLFALTS